MLSTLILENFKPFGQRQWIPLAPITLIFGANSSGKSSILQSLLLLRQTLLEAGANELLRFSGDIVNLGEFSDIIFRHEYQSRVCEIAPLLRWPEMDSREDSDRVGGEPQPIQQTYLLQPYQPTPTNDIGSGFRFAFDDELQRMELVGVPYYWRDLRQPLFMLDIDRLNAEGPISDNDRRARLGRITREHPLWAELYGSFTQHTLPGVHEAFEEIVERLDHLEATSTAVEALLGTPQYRDVSDRVRAEDTARRHFLQVEQQLYRWVNYKLDTFVDDTIDGNAATAFPLRNFLPEPSGDGIAPVVSGALPLESFLIDTMELDRDAVYSALRGKIPDLVTTSRLLARRLRRELINLIYLGPIRCLPSRHTVVDGTSSRYVGKRGEYFPDVLVGDLKMALGEDSNKCRTLIDEVNQRLRDHALGYSILASPIHLPERPDLDPYYVALRDEATRTIVTFLDVGFGIGQVLPIIVQALAVENRLIVIEQPELHLHARVQAELGEILALAALQQRNQLIIETHSEHMILRLRKLIRHGTIRASDVSVVYVVKDERGSWCKSIGLDDSGEFKQRWPGGFFQERLQEVFG